VAVFVELFRQRQHIHRQAARLRETELHEQQLLREHAEARLVAELREGIRARDDFLSIAAHELKTPMTPLRLQTSGLLREIRRRGVAGLRPSGSRASSTGCSTSRA
jgi:signal transduction histidine kinase